RLERNLRHLDQIGPGLGEALRLRIGQVARTHVPAGASLFRVLATLPSFSREQRERRAALRSTLNDYGQYFPNELRANARAITECYQIYRTEVRAAAADAVLRSWRGLHRLSALLMVSLVVLHIAIAWYYGFIWATSG